MKEENTKKFFCLKIGGSPCVSRGLEDWRAFV